MYAVRDTHTFICCSLLERGGLFVLAPAFLSLVLPPVLTAGVAAADLEALLLRRRIFQHTHTHTNTHI